MQVGDKVLIQDFSEAHGDTGTIFAIQKNGIILVELDENQEKGIEPGTVWPILDAAEIIIQQEADDE